MRIHIAAIGRMKQGPERELVSRYLERAVLSGKPLGLSGFDVGELPESRASSAASRKADEAKALRAALPEGVVVDVLRVLFHTLAHRRTGNIIFKIFLRLVQIYNLMTRFKTSGMPINLTINNPHSAYAGTNRQISHYPRSLTSTSYRLAQTNHGRIIL